MDQLQYSDSTPKKGSEARNSMIGIETIRKIRLDKEKDLSVREISKKRCVDRKTVNTILSTGRVFPSYSKRKKQVFPKLGEFIEPLEKILEEENKLSLRKRCKFTRVFEKLVALGYRGGYDSVRRHCTLWLKDKNNESYKTGCIPMSFSSGEAFQFDWGTKHAIINGTKVLLKIGVMTLCHSRMCFARAYHQEKTEMLLDFHVKAFAFFGGSCRRGIYDNMKTAVTKIYPGQKRDWQKDFDIMSSHYLFEHNACTPREPQEKGRVERSVQTVEEDFFKPCPEFDTLTKLNEGLEDNCVMRSRTRMHPDIKDKTVGEVFLEEKKELILVSNEYDAYVSRTCCISKTQLVQYGNNHYSVPLTNGKTIDLRVYADKLVFVRKGEVIAEHSRIFDRDKIVTCFQHYLNSLDRKPGSIRNGIPFQDENLPSIMVDLRHKMRESFDDSERQFVDILCAVQEFGVDAVSSACELALESSLASKDAVLNILYRTKLHPVVENIPEPEHLILKNPPSDNCSDYNQLLKETFS